MPEINKGLHLKGSSMLIVKRHHLVVSLNLELPIVIQANNKSDKEEALQSYLPLPIKMDMSKCTSSQAAAEISIMFGWKKSILYGVYKKKN